MILEAQGVSVTAAAGGRPIPVLRDLSFALAPGQVLGIVGESGAGKSMVGRTIAQALPPGFAVSGGALRFAGEDLIALPSARRRALLGRDIAFIPQEPRAALNPVLTIGQQFREHLARLGVTAWRPRAEALLAAVHLRDPAALLARYPHQLSGGMCQRVLIALAFAGEPRLVVADEPTTALDATVQAQIVRLIRELQSRAATAILFITHDLRLAASLCDDLLVLYAGRPLERGPARRVLATPQHPYTRCLQLATPALTGTRAGLYSLPGQMPGLFEAATLPGCRFAPRCPVTTPDCTAAEPALQNGTACLHPGRIPAIMPPPAPLAPATRPASPVLTARALCRTYTAGALLGRRIHTAAVRDASFAVGEGEFVALVGESGSGKSTIARLIMGLDPPTAGELTLAGQPIPASPRAARALRLATVQMIFQDPQSALNPRRRVGDLITQPLRAPRPARQARAAALLAQVGLPPDAALRTPAQLSGGQRQRVTIARALCTLPKLLIADEIVSGLDVSVQAQLLDLLLELRDRHGFAMLFISHDLAVVRHLCTRTLVMHQGEIVEQGDTERLFADPQHPYTRTLLAAARGE